MAFTIESGLAIPKKSSPGRPSKYPWRALGVGDSFFVPGHTTETFAGSVNYARRKTGFTLVSRTVDGGVRIWRTA